MLFLNEYLRYRKFEICFEIYEKKQKKKVIRLSRIELAINFLQFFENLYFENSIKFRNFCDIDAVSRCIFDVSKI